MAHQEETATQDEHAPEFAAQHYSPAEIASAWGISADTVRRLFEHEADVLVIEAPASRASRRRYRTLRIPAAVVERVHRRLSVINESKKE